MFPNFAQAALFLQNFDFSQAVVKLIASVPGRYSGNDLWKYLYYSLPIKFENILFDFLYVWTC